MLALQDLEASVTRQIGNVEKEMKEISGKGYGGHGGPMSAISGPISAISGLFRPERATSLAPHPQAFSPASPDAPTPPSPKFHPSPAMWGGLIGGGLLSLGARARSGLSTWVSPATGKQRETERDRDRQTLRRSDSDTSVRSALGALVGEVKEEDSCDEELEGAETAALMLAKMKNVSEAPNFERPGVLLDPDEQVLTS